MISDTSINEVKQAIDIEDIISGFVSLKKSGSGRVGLCPFHNEKSPSFSINKAKSIFKCFGCGKGGDAIDFVQEHLKLTYIDAIKWIASKYNITIQEEGVKEYTKPQPRLEKLGSKFLSHFEKNRHISNDTLLRFKITEGMEWMPKQQKEIPVVCFNYYRDGELVNIKYRGADKSFKMSSGAQLIFYNLDAIKDEDECVIVEGEIDCLSLHESGIYNSVSVPNGAAPGVQRLEYLDNCYRHFEKKKKIIIAVDNDDPGRLLRDELVRRLGAEKCWIVQWPDGIKDTNELLIKKGKGAVKDLINNAVEWPLEGILNLEDFEDELDFIYENGYPKGLKCKIPEFDDLLSFYPGQMTIFTGIPGSGKSEFVNWIMVSLSKFHDVKWGIASFETTPTLHATQLAEKFNDKSFGFRKDPAHRMNPTEYRFAKDMIRRYFYFLNLDMISVTMDGLLQKAEELILRKGITGLLFDPWNCIEHKRPAGMSETEYVLVCLNKFIHFIGRYKVHGFLVAHPTKMPKDPKTKQAHIPTLNDISGSAHFFNRTHNGVTIHRDKATGMVGVYVQKVKHSWLGQLGFCTFGYNTMTRQYTVLNAKEDNDNPSIPLALPALETGWRQVDGDDDEQF